VPGSDLLYYRASISRQQFFALGRDFTLVMNGEYAQADGLNGKELPFYKNYYAGGVGSVRGFKTASLGPCDRDVNCTPPNTERIGGNRKVLANAEVLAPMPGMGLDRSVRLAAFFDSGMVWGKSQALVLDDLRYSAGVGVAWFSPIGPMKFSYAIPLRIEPGDLEERFQFQLGSVF
jgi:outer membrane protein insertion porin family